MCIGKYDIICIVTEDTLSFAEVILDDLKIISAVSPNVNIVTFEGEKKLYIIALPLYARKIKKLSIFQQTAKQMQKFPLPL